MRNLLSAGFARLWRSKLFYAGILVVAAQVAYTLANNLYYKRLWGLETLSATNLIFAGTYFLPAVIAVFVSFYVGTDHSDGIFRNKLTVGHSHASIYLAHLILCAVAALIMYAAGSVPVIAIGAPLLGGFSGVAHELVAQIFCSLLSVVALTSLTVLCAVLISRKAVGVIVTPLLALGLSLAVSPELDSRLSAPESIGGWSYTDAEGILHEIPVQPNPDYLAGGKRVAVEFLHGFLPTGQIGAYGEFAPEHLALFPLYALLFTVLTTLCGILLFRRKDLK